MDFEESSKVMRLNSVHPGVTVSQVVQNTGFELIVPNKVPETLPPTDKELSIIRDKIDLSGNLRNQNGF